MVKFLMTAAGIAALCAAAYWIYGGHQWSTGEHTRQTLSSCNAAISSPEKPALDRPEAKRSITAVDKCLEDNRSK